ncbi:hypothetical protein C2W62_18440 [Candidatus Entotheonella serta]|nr:hypothetical protein C2W62_18440 [Candidatus Entotheonella serta]
MKLPQITFTLVTMALLSIAQPTLSVAGCGCIKPPPLPAMAIPNAAFKGLSVTFFHSSFQVGQTWTLDFHSGSQTRTVTASVVEKRDITDPSGNTTTPQLVVSLPNVPVGPTRIEGFSGTNAFTVPSGSFTVIARPVQISEQSAEYDIENYTTGVGADGTLYVSVGGLDDVCRAMAFEVSIEDYPLRINHIAIINAQGFFIDALGLPSADIFFLEPGDEDDSDTVHYLRHAFEQYCAAHQPGQAREVDPGDPSWHLHDGSPHVDYGTLIFAITGQLQGGSAPAAGSVTLDLEIETELGTGTEDWEEEQEEEDVDDDD